MHVSAETFVSVATLWNRREQPFLRSSYSVALRLLEKLSLRRSETGGLESSLVERSGTNKCVHVSIGCVRLLSPGNLGCSRREGCAIVGFFDNLLLLLVLLSDTELFIFSECTE